MLSKGITYENLIEEFGKEADRAGIPHTKVTKADIQNLTRGSGLFQLPTILTLQRLGFLPGSGVHPRHRPRNGEDRNRRTPGSKRVLRGKRDPESV
jgi:hypothetical protein